MVKVSEFYGIEIHFWYHDHPPPHFHAEYAGHRIKVSIDSLEVVTGSAPRRVIGMVLEWARLHQRELREGWELARQKEQLKRIEPLD
jgi:hypothetical protein